MCYQAYGVGLINPLFDAYFVAVESCLTSNYGEFAIINWLAFLMNAKLNLNGFLNLAHIIFRKNTSTVKKP